MARALDQILQELQPAYDPQRQVYQQQMNILPGQETDQLKGLDAAKQDSFSQITDAANRRGLFYSGIPVAEEQRYTGAQYLPAVANLKANFANRKFQLQDALAQLQSDAFKQAQGIQQDELNREQQAAAARAATSAATPSFGFGGFGGYDTGATGGNASAAPQYDPNQVRAATAVKSLLATNNQNLINQTYQAIAKSAGYGNTYDQMKLALLNQLWLGGQPSTGTQSYNTVPTLNGQTTF